jgi:nucleotide-binding universal stress UspA family protein
MNPTNPKILVPLDGSDFAEQALGPALALARRSGGEIHLVSAVSSFPLLRPADSDQAETKGWFAEEGPRVEAYLAEVRGRIQGDTPEQVVRIHARVGAPAASIVQRVEEVDINLVVMTTHGRGALGRAWLGSVADAVVRQSPCPVLLLRPEEGTVTLELERILVPLDGSEASARALGEAESLARLWGSELYLASVIPTPPAIAVPYMIEASAESEAVRQSLETDYQNYLEEAAAPLRERGLPVETATQRADNVHGGLLELLEKTRAGLLVMSTQGRGGVARLFLGSVANRMVRSSPVPVLVIPPAR